MIGGADIVLMGRTQSHDADLLLRTIRAWWREAWVQTADSEHAVEIGAFRFPASPASEYFVYRDRTSLESWRDHGATSENQSTMLHIIIAPDSTTIVVDHEHSALASQAWSWLRDLQNNRIRIASAA